MQTSTPARAIDPSWRAWLRAENARVRRQQTVRRVLGLVVLYLGLAALGIGLGWLTWAVLP